MKKNLKILFGCLLAVTCVASICILSAYSKGYTKKTAYSGFGKRSSINGLPKTKITSGHMKKTSKGYTYVNPYARSK